MVVGIGADHVEHLGEERLRDNDAVALALGRGHTHHHGFGRGRGAVVHRCVRHVHARETRHHRLVFKDVLQCALRNLRLVGRVGRGKLGALAQVAHHRGDVAVIYAAAGEAAQRTVFGSHGTDGAAHLHLGLGMRYL